MISNRIAILNYRFFARDEIRIRNTEIVALFNHKLFVSTRRPIDIWQIHIIARRFELSRETIACLNEVTRWNCRHRSLQARYPLPHKRYVRVNEKSDKGGSFSIREERRDDERTTKREKESTWPREIERWRVLFQKTIARIRHLRVDDRRRSSAHRLTFKGIYWAELGSSQRR